MIASAVPYGTGVLIIIVGYLVFRHTSKQQEATSNQDRKEHMAKWDTLAKQHESAMTMLAEAHKSEVLNITTAHKEEIERMFTLHERNTQATELIAAQVRDLGHKITAIACKYPREDR